MTDLEAKELLDNGHSLEELVELFSDKQEQHDLYVNSGLVQRDFEHIIVALKEQLIHNRSLSGHRIYTIAKEEDGKILYLCDDKMLGTMHLRDCFEELGVTPDERTDSFVWAANHICSDVYYSENLDDVRDKLREISSFKEIQALMSEERLFIQELIPIYKSGEKIGASV